MISHHNDGSLFVSITSYGGLISGIIGGIGYLFIGVFSLDRSGPDGLYHGVCAILAFSGFVLSIFFFSLRFFLQDKVVLNLFGIGGVTVPLIMLILNVVYVNPFLEWMLLFSILFHIVPLNYLSIAK